MSIDSKKGDAFFTSEYRFSRATLASFALVFGLLGTYIVLHSSAAGLNTADAFKKVAVGNGFVEASARQLVRTSSDMVYIITDSDLSGDHGLHIYKGNQSGIPTAFSEVDNAHRPTPSGSVLGSPDIRLDHNNIIQMAYNDAGNKNLYYQTFNTNTNTWGSRTVLASNALTGANTGGGEGRTGNVALVLDNNDQPNIVYMTNTSSILYLGPNGSGGFNAPVTIASGVTNAIHPSLAWDGNNILHLSYVDNTAPIYCGGGCSGRTSPSANVKYAQRSASGSWSSVETVATGNAAVDNNIYLDQGPNIATNSSNQPFIEYIDAGSSQVMHIKYRTGVNTWADDSPPSTSYGSTHTPTIYIAGNDIYPILGHDKNINYGYLYQLGGPGNTWHPFVLLDSTKNDGSANARWDPFRDNDPAVIDTLYMNETTPSVFYMAILPSGSGTDGIPPTVSLSAPSNGATVSGTTAVSATAADNVGVVGVQFKLDGANIGAEDTASPYSINWDTTGAVDGAHTLTAVARDAAGNSTTSSGVNVTVNNTAPVDGTPPTVSMTAPPDGSSFNASSTSVAVSADAADNVGVVGVQFKLDGVNLGAEDTTSPYSINWNTTTATDGSHTLTAVARDAAGNSTTSTGIIVNVDHIAPTVSISAPTNGAAVSGSAVTVSANASDDIDLANVQFKLDGVNLGAADSTSPYSITWDSTTATNGTHTLTALATDFAGNSTTSSSVTVTVDNVAPTGSITAPAASAIVRGSSVTVSSNSADSGSGVASAQFQRSPAGTNTWTTINTDNTNPYSITWNTTTIADGLYDLRVITTDNAGNTFTSPTVVNVRVDNTAPSVSISAPAANAFLKGSSVTVSATASDSGSGIANVQFKLDGSNLGAADTTSPYSIVWDTTSATNGAHTLTAVATDAVGNTTNSSTISVTVDNVAPTVSLSAPSDGATVSGATAVSATAADNVGVIGVQFKLDGVNMGAEDTTSSYSINWDTSTATEGSHSLSAIARDAAGNITTSTVVTVTVNNVVAVTGDINKDGSVNIFDLSLLLSSYGATSRSSCVTNTNYTCDLNNDNTINIFDLSILLSHYGT